MAHIEIVSGNALYPKLDKPWNVLAHVVNNVGAFGAGFAAQLSKTYPESKKSYLEWTRSSSFKLGAIETCVLNEKLVLAHLCCQDGLPGYSNPQPLRYDHFKSCLKQLSLLATAIEADIHMPHQIGCGLARGNWACVYTLLETSIPNNINLYLYDHRYKN